MNSGKHCLSLVLMVAAAIVAVCAPTHAQNSAQLLKAADRLGMLGNWEKARPLFAQAETMYQSRGDVRDALYAKLGRLRADLESSSYVDMSNYLSQELNTPLLKHDASLRLRALSLKGVADLNTNTLAAKRDWTEVLNLARSSNDEIWQERATGWLGIVAFVEGNTADAARKVAEAIQSASLLHDADGEITFLTYLGDGLVEYDRPEQALASLNEALQIAESTPGVGFPIRTYIAKVSALVKLRRQAEARALLEHALDYARKTGTLGAQADLLLQFGQLEEEEHHPRAARIDYQQSAAVARKAQLPRLLGDAMFRLTSLDERSGDVGDAAACARQGVEAVREVGEPYELPHYLAIEARLEAAQGAYWKADELYSEAGDLVEGMLVNVASPGQESELLSDMSEVYAQHFALAATRLHNLPEALRVLEEARGRVMNDQLREHRFTGGSRSSGPSPIELEIARLQRDLRQSHTEQERKRLLQALHEDEIRLWPTEYANPRARLFEAKPIDLKALRAALRPDEIILEYVAGDPNSYCLLITHETTELRVLPGLHTLNPLIDKFLIAIRHRDSIEAPAKRLCACLLPASVMRKRLIIVPDGRLNLIPFEALVDLNGNYIINSHVVSYSPSSTVWYLLTSASPSRVAKRPFLGVGYSSTSLPARQKEKISGITRGLYDAKGVTFGPLPFARDEVFSAARIAGNGSVVLLGNEATESNLKAEPLGNFQVLHFAVHAVADFAEPDRSALVLRYDPSSDEDGLWQAREIRQTQLHAELVTLSACDTGIGRPEGEEGIENLVRAFLLAGARSVVSSLWAVEDQSADTLMTAFYKHLGEGFDKASALRQAKLDILTNYGPITPPYDWAAFTLTGEERGHLSFARRK
jgi:tetratricopeptide (TPR) repeat protein